MKNSKYLIILHIVLAIYSLLGISSKLASETTFLSLKFILLYSIVLCNLFGYAIIWQQILKKVSLVTAYANKAATIIWGIIWGAVFFQESICVKKIIGVIIIIFGIYFVVSSDKVKEDEI